MASQPVEVLPRVGQARPYHATEFRAFKVSERVRPPYNPLGPWQKTYDLGLVRAASLDEAVNAAVVSYSLDHKEHLIIRETSDRGCHLHLYAIKRRSAGRKVYANYDTRVAHDLYPEIVCSIDCGVML